MEPADVESVIHAKPFRPYRLVMVDGEVLQVRKPRKSHVSGDQIALVGYCRKPGGGPAVEKFRLLAVERVVTAEVIDPADPI